jgi:hypothetical protein
MFSQAPIAAFKALSIDQPNSSPASKLEEQKPVSKGVSTFFITSYYF